MACIAKRRGRYVIDFYDQAGKRRWKTLPEGTTSKQAKDELKAITDQVQKGLFRPDREIPLFFRVAQAWLEHKKGKLRETTWEVYEGHVRNHFADFNELKINQITIAAIENFINLRQTEGMNINTLRKVLVTLGQILSYAVRHRFVEYNFLRDAERPRDPKEDDGEIRVLSPGEIQLFLKCVKNPKYRTLFMVAIMTGMRQGELLGLRWQDVSFTDNQIYVQRTFNKGRFFNTKTKSSKRQIDIGPTVATELKRWKLACPNSNIELVFPTSTGEPINYSNMVNRHFRPALRAMIGKNLDAGKTVKNVGSGIVGLPLKGHFQRAGDRIIVASTSNYDGEHIVLPTSTPDLIHIESSFVKERIKAASVIIAKDDLQEFTEFTNVRFHDLRHTYASLLIAQGENIKYIQKQLGHSSPMVTLNVYAHLLESKNQDAACRLESKIFG